MNGADTRTKDEAPPPSQLPTPARSPSPSYLAPNSHVASPTLSASPSQPASPAYAPISLPDRLIDTIIDKYDGSGSGSLSTSSLSSRRPSFNDEAILSDASDKVEKMRPVPITIRRPGDGRRKSSVSEHDKMLKLSPKQILELTSEPASLPIRAATPILEEGETPPEGKVEEVVSGVEATENKKGMGELHTVVETNGTSAVNEDNKGISRRPSVRRNAEIVALKSPGDLKLDKEIAVLRSPSADPKLRPALNSRTVSTPVIRRKLSTRGPQGHVPPPLNLDHKENIGPALKPSAAPERHRSAVSPMPTSMPLPPLSMPTFLSLELSADRPSPLYIYRPSADDFPYESSKIKYERLVNFLFLPPKLEGILGFGALACLDAWMHILTILPLRFVLAVFILVKWWGSVIVKEARDLASFVWSGMGRVWRRRRMGSEPPTPLMTPAEEHPPNLPTPMRGLPVSVTSSSTTARENGNSGPYFSLPEPKEKQRMRSSRYRHRRTKSTPSALLPSHKADILKGLLVITSCAVLMRFDPSRMYHGIRGQSAIKLYVIYNVLEVCDRLLSAVGQDVLECLFSRETLDRNSDGRSKVIRPFWMFVLALVYNVTHAAALFYQVITLNVAVNSYSNALLTLLLSNQFVEIKGTVFKRFEKENLFQVTCADIVERFQLWLMLLIIAMRNIVEVGGLSIKSGGDSSSSWASLFSGSGNSTTAFTAASVIPRSFTVFPTWIGQVLNPFLLVLGSEMLVDWLKHAYITKFNQTKPEVYDKFLDVLAKDYYSNAFTDPNLTKRLGLPVLPLACLFIRAAIQTYHMFIATHMPAPFPSLATSLTTESTSTSSPATTAALAHIDQIFRRALGRSSFGGGAVEPTAWYEFKGWTLDDGIALFTMCTVFLVGYLFFLATKLLLGMFLLSVSRNRYHGMKTREKIDTETGGKKLGGFGLVDVDEEKRKWIYNDDPETLARLRERDEKGARKEREEREKGVGYGHVSRYAMVAKRIW